ncbi:LLM class flavin-dependent oxidoreductase [Nocardia sp. NBC_00508]|uniref:LLM class flavin-dependent oxidoreductase n=1 Tax=Nocardia sp. NBC_00508 TaxID=2975992 RepID=UPI002E80A3DC|nr:LLM class flavin-dependent oxidoreductase [Nocardia sp. NBC_00508]WUD65862.1 LLM class flavin-dependent oxidoreductase [Nocardia sp. NBC_00508]
MRFGLMFGCQTLPGAEASLDQPYRDMLDCLPEAEALGYASVFMPSHHAQPDGWCPSPLLGLAAAAAVTERMRLGTAVLLLPLYAPVKLAEDVTVLDNLSGGRVVLGVAPGYVSDEFALHNVPRAERNGRFEEAVDILEAALSGEEFAFDGRYFHVPATRLTPPPVQRPHPPIWYGVSGERALRRAARRGCVVVGSPRHNLDELREHRRTYESEARAVGFEIPERPLVREVFVAETMSEAVRVAGPGIEHQFRELYGAKSQQGERMLRTDAGTAVADKQEVDLDAIRSRLIVGDPEHAIAQLRQLEAQLGITETICWMHLPGVDRDRAMASVRLFAEEVMPAFSDMGGST